MVAKCRKKITSFAERKVPEVVKSQLTYTIASCQDLTPYTGVQEQGFISVPKELGAKYTQVQFLTMLKRSVRK